MPLLELLKIPSISTQEKYKPAMKRTREFLVKEFKSMGFETKILKGMTHDAVFAQLTVDRLLPTVLIYGHYDVQPPEPLEEWKTPPFEPKIINDYIYARGSADNKGQFMIHIMAVRKLIERSDKRPKINFKFLIEGEEEIGSPSVESLAKKYAKDLFKCDYVIVSDTSMLNKDQPVISVCLRGLVCTEICIETAKNDLHSGSWGGIADNPAIILSRVISELKRKDGSINIRGFYDDINTPSEELLAHFKKNQSSEKDFVKNEQIFYTAGEERHSFAERKYFRPTLDVNGIYSGYTEKGSKTVIPCCASAKISMRLVPNQNPEKIYKLFQKRIKEIVPKQAKVTITAETGCLPYIAPTNHPVFGLIIQSLKKIYKSEPVYNGCGGSIGFVPIMAKALKVPVIMVGFELPGSNIHAPNENFSLSNYYKGIKVFEDFYSHVHEIDN